MTAMINVIASSMAMQSVYGITQPHLHNYNVLHTFELVSSVLPHVYDYG